MQRVRLSEFVQRHAFDYQPCPAESTWRTWAAKGVLTKIYGVEVEKSPTGRWYVIVDERPVHESTGNAVVDRILGVTGS